MKAAAYFVLSLWLILWLQLVGNYYVAEAGLSANIILVVVLYFGLTRGPLMAELLGFVWGLLIDASSLGLMGMHALLYSLAGHLAGLLRRQLDETKAWTQAIFTLAISLLYLVFYFGLDRLFSYGPQPVSWRIV